MPIIQITNTYKGNVLQLVKNCVPNGFEIRTLPENNSTVLADYVTDADYILASGRVKINEQVLSRAKKLKMIQRTGVGLDSLDLDAIRKYNIPVYVNQGVNSQSVAEHTLLLILACLRKLCLINSNTKNGIWEKQSQGITTRELAGRTVGIIGMGNIGRNVAKILKIFNAKIVYYDQFRQTEQTEAELGITYAPLNAVLSMADIVTLHCPLTEQTNQLICEDTLRIMREGVVIVNTSRGALIDESALLSAIENGKIGCVGLDVHAEEPIPKGDKLISSDHVIATPHIGGVTYDSFYRMINDAMRNIALFEQGKKEEIESLRLKSGV